MLLHNDSISVRLAYNKLLWLNRFHIQIGEDSVGTAKIIKYHPELMSELSPVSLAFIYPTPSMLKSCTTLLFNFLM